ncbi:Hypothetical protein CINCED_3A023078, partial [Cinara cedri]
VPAPPNSPNSPSHRCSRLSCISCLSRSTLSTDEPQSSISSDDDIDYRFTDSPSPTNSDYDYNMLQGSPITIPYHALGDDSEIQRSLRLNQYCFYVSDNDAEYRCIEHQNHAGRCILLNIWGVSTVDRGTQTDNYQRRRGTKRFRLTSQSSDDDEDDGRP